MITTKSNYFLRFTATICIAFVLALMMDVTMIAQAQGSDQAPTGALDLANCDVIAGWAFDPDTSSESISVHFYADNPAGSGTFIGAVPASDPRPDINTAFSITGNHGFNFLTPASIKTGTHPIFAYAINSNPTGSNFHLLGSPKTVSNCTAADKPPIGSLDLANCDVIAGWAFDPDTSSENISVHFYADNPAGSGTFIGAALAGDSRPDINTAYQITGNHGFNMLTPASLKTGSHKIFAYGINTNSSGGNRELSGSPKTINCQAPPIPPPPPTNLVCDPLPMDPDLILECNAQMNENPPPPFHPPGTDPLNPTTLPFTGTWGLDAAYNSKTNQVLVVASDNVGGVYHIKGQLVDPVTMQTIGQSFQIDQGSGSFVGTPRVAYNPTSDSFYVAWEDTRPCPNCRANYGRVVSGSGVPQGNDVMLASGPSFMRQVTVDPLNNTFLVAHDMEKGVPSITTIAANGSVGPAIAPTGASLPFQGQSNVMVNTATNELWSVYAAVLSGNNTSSEDDRIYLQRMTSAGQKVGEPIQLSQTRLGRGAVAEPKIAFDPSTGTAVAVWMERERDGVSGFWGRAIYSDGTLGPEFPILTATLSGTSEGYGNGTLKFNPFTQTFFLSAGDWDGGAMLVEFDAYGLIYSTEQVIAPPAMPGQTGNFNIAIAPTPGGAVTVSSLNLAVAAGVSNLSANAVTPPALVVGPPPPPVQVILTPDTKSLPQLINQIYIWSLGVGALLALLMTVIGGYYIMTASGNADQARKGKEYIWGSIIGLTLLFTSFLILRTINPDLVNFNLNSLTDLTPTK